MNSFIRNIRYMNLDELSTPDIDPVKQQAALRCRIRESDLYIFSEIQFEAEGSLKELEGGMPKTRVKMDLVSYKQTI
jgi:hypothetical protein